MTRSGSFPDSGQRIGAYEVQSLLGRGGMGEVFLAWDHRLRRRVAIKRVRSDRGIDDPCRQRLLREARAVAGLSHPAIVQVHDLIENEDENCIVLEYVEGKTLAATLADGALEPTHAIRLAREIADGLAAAHSVGIVHRDLKPENVIVTSTGHAKILDFGLARLLTPEMDDTQLTRDGMLVGTFHMMSPEQATCGETDERSDLFSLGVLLYEMLTGLSPFRGATPQETLRRVLSQNPPRVDAVRPGLPERLGDLVEDLLAKEPATRPGSAAEVARDLKLISTLLAAVAAPGPSASVSDLSTVVDIPRSAGSRSLPKALEGSSTERSLLWSPNSWKIAVALAVLLVGAALFLRQPKPTRVLVVRPEVDPKDSQLRLAASGVLASSLNTLGSLQGIVPVDASQVMGSPKLVAEMAQSAAAQEVLVLKIERTGNLGRVMLQRIQVNDNSSLGNNSSDFPIEPQKLLSLNDGVGALIRQIFHDHPPKPGKLTFDASPEDYASFLEVEDLIDAGPSKLMMAHKQLEGIVLHAPDFMEARVRAIEVAIRLYQQKREVAYLHYARNLVEHAEQHTSDNPRTLISRFNLDLAARDLNHASATLLKLQNLMPGEPQTLRLRANLAEAQGRLKKALDFQEEVADAIPSWKNLLMLAKLQARCGQVQNARDSLNKITDEFPKNLWASGQLAEIELEYGDAGKAEQMYRDLIESSHDVHYYTNLGVALVLRQRYGEAIDAFNQALTLDPEHVETTLNLADAELALGNKEKADAHYDEVLHKLDGDSSGEAALMRAQCLAHLKHFQEADKIVQDTLRQHSDDPATLTTAALVYTLADNKPSALDTIKLAIDKGVGPNWFKLPAFAPLFDKPEFRRLIDRDTH